MRKYTDSERIRIFNLMEIVINEAKGGYADYAKTYARHTVTAYYTDGDNGINHQIPYVLSNLGYWRGDLARDTKTELKSFL